MATATNTFTATNVTTIIATTANAAATIATTAAAAPLQIVQQFHQQHLLLQLPIQT